MENVVFDGRNIFQRRFQNRTFPNRVHKKIIFRVFSQSNCVFTQSNLVRIYSLLNPTTFSTPKSQTRAGAVPSVGGTHRIPHASMAQGPADSEQIGDWPIT